MVIGKVAVDLAKKRFHRAAQSAEKLLCKIPSHPIATIDRYFHRSGKSNVIDDSREIAFSDIERSD